MRLHESLGRVYTSSWGKMKKLKNLCAIVLTALLLVISVAGCQQQAPDVIETIYIFKAHPLYNPPPPGGWTFQTTGPHPARVQGLFDPGDKIFLGLVISERLKGDTSFSRFTFFNKGTGAEEEIRASPGDLGPFEPDGEYLPGLQNPWEVPDKDGKYELRLYLSDEVVASALFNVGIWPASWGLEMVRRPAPIYEVRMNTSEEEPRVSVYIKGGLPQGCEASHGYSVEQLIDDTIYIKATIRHLKDVPCEDYIYFEETVNLWPSLLKNFNSGETYKVNVNGYTTTFVMP